MLAIVLEQLGYPAQALQKGQEALALARELTHPLSLVLALGAAAQIHRRRGEQQTVQALEEERSAIALEQGFTQDLALGNVRQGWDLVEKGQHEQGLEQIGQGLAAVRGGGTELNRPHFLALLAEAYGKVGQPEEGLKVLAEALATVNNTEVRFYEAELYRLKGELTLQLEARGLGLETGSPSPQASRLKPHVSSGAEQEAEACFHKAIEVARQQQAKSLELRAVMSLSWLWQQQGKRAEARQMLAEIYGWFTEGFDTKDLQEAKALLEELA